MTTRKYNTEPRRCIEIPGIAKLTQEQAEEISLETIRRLKNNGGNYEEIAQAEMELTGGHCQCGKPWRKVESTGPIGTLAYWKPTCGCLENQRLRRTEAEAEQILKGERYHAARIPKPEWVADWSNWDYRAGASLNDSMKWCQDYYKSQQWRHGQGVILCGAVGAGKTRCAIMLLKSIMDSDPKLKGYFLPMSDLLSMVIRSQTEGGMIQDLLENQVIVIDDMDKVPVDKEWARTQIFAFYDSMFREGVTMIGTTNMNKGAPEWTTKFDYSVYSRLQGKCSFEQFEGGRENDYRLLKRKWEMEK